MLTYKSSELTPLLHMLSQPAFCLAEDGSTACSRSALYLAPHEGEAFEQWLGEAAGTYAQWDGAGTLELPVHRGDVWYICSIQRTADGLFCLLSPNEPPEATVSALSVTAQVLRQPLGDLAVHLQRLEAHTEDGACHEHTAAIQRQLYRMSRIAANLSDLGALQAGTWRRIISRRAVPEELEELAWELDGLCREAGRSFVWNPPQKCGFVSADWELVRRALFNLLSNAIKFSPQGTPITLRGMFSGEMFLFQMENICQDGSEELLHSAFRRLENRAQIPDSHWGIGLGLPIVHAIARLHGGRVAAELHEQTAVVTLSLRCRPVTSGTMLRGATFSYTGGARQSLIELSDVLPDRAYRRLHCTI